jgi:replicative DNA helicase
LTDQLPPHDLRAEESLLGAMLLSKDAIVTAAERLDPGDFYNKTHGHIFDAITSLHEAGEPADPVTVADELRRAGLLAAVGGPATLVTLQAGTPATSTAGRYAQIIKDHHLMRRLIAAGVEIAKMGYDMPTDVARAAGGALDLVKAIVEATDRDLKLYQLSELLGEHIDEMERREAGERLGLPTGWVDVDEVLGGLRAGDLVILGARPAMGKSLMGLNMAEYTAKRGGNVLFASLEMSRTQLLDRLYASTAPVDHSAIHKGRLSPQEWTRVAFATGTLSEYGIYIADNPSLSMADIHALARRVPSLDLIVIDYLQLVTARDPRANREQQVNDMAWAAKVMGRELGVPVLLISQLSRKVEDRLDKRPIAADLRDSGGIEQHADKILFLYRDEVYHPDSSQKGKVEIIIDKNRTGRAKTSVELAFLGHQARLATMPKAGDAGRGQTAGPPVPSGGGSAAADALKARLARRAGLAPGA